MMERTKVRVFSARRWRAWMGAWLALAWIGGSQIPVHAGTYTFGSNANGLNAAPGPASVSLSDGEFELQLLAGPAGAVLRETNGVAGLGVDSSPLAPTTTDILAFSLSLLGGSGPLAGTGEFITFSFDRPGILTGLNFDGL